MFGSTLSARSRLLARLGADTVRFIRGIRDLALPAQCAVCREPVADDGLCGACWSRVSFIAEPYCPRLGIPFVYDPGEPILSSEAIARPPAYTRARATVHYDDAGRALVHALKFQDRLDLAPLMGRWMARAGHELLRDADAIVPVPLHWRRSLARRFNQSGALAQAISRETQRPVRPEALKRVRATEHQIGLSREDRAANVQGAFTASPDVKGQHLVLVDDVLTSGATADACARALLRAGAAQVDCLVFARVTTPGRLVDRGGPTI